MTSNRTLMAVLLTFALLLAACGPANSSGNMPNNEAGVPIQEDMATQDDTMDSDKMDDSMDSDKMDDSMDSDKMDDSMDSDKMDDSMDSDKMDDSMDSDKMDDSMDSDKMDDSMDSDKMDDSMDSDKMDDSMDSDKTDGSMDSDKMDDSMHGLDLEVNLTGLADLGPGWAYEGWLIIDGSPVSTGVFTVDADGMISTESFPVSEHAAKATAFVLTIEPVPDPDASPSATHLLGGDFMDGAASLSVAHPAALADDFTSAGGTYILGIPTSDSPNDSYRSGIWFTGLTLPGLPNGWVYEGWVVGPDGPVSTGRFTDLMAADSDGAGPTAGPKPGPALVGQDFIDPPLDLTSGYAAVISIEPEPDNSPTPFALKILVDDHIDDSGDHGPQEIDNQAASLPTGLVTLSTPMK